MSSGAQRQETRLRGSLVLYSFSMKTQKPSAGELEYLTRKQNPYDFVTFDEGPEEHATELGLEEKLECIRKRKNPYLYYEAFHEAGLAQEAGLPCASPPNALKPQQTPRSSISKEDFAEGCRRIFRMYVPPEEGNKLRPYYRDFILRNQNQSSEQRFRILEELRKYDLSTTGNLKPQFNRGQELLTQRKLQQVEQAAGGQR